MSPALVEMPEGVDPVEFCYEQGWTDGLPVVPPTEDRVAAMLEAAGGEPDEVLCRVAPRWGEATRLKVAVNAVMAGCRPEYFPLLRAALRALCDERFNLNGVQATTHVCAPLTIVNGPVAKRLGLNAGANVFGQGFRANATIGRAIRLILTNIGGGVPGVLDKSTFGHPGKYTYCIAENEDASPWEPLHLERGLSRDASAVTVFAAEAPHSVTNHISNDAYGILTSCADTMATMGCNNAYVMGEFLVAIGPEHAAAIAADGWTKDDVRSFLYEHARQPMGKLRFHGRYGNIYNRHWPRWLDRTRDDEMVPVVRRPEDILLIVAGGSEGRFSVCVPGWGEFGSRSVTVAV